MGKLSAYIRAGGPHFKWLFYVASFTCGMVIGSGEIAPIQTWLLGALIFPVFGQWGIRLVNDYYDQECDRLQDEDPFPETRAILSGEITPKEAFSAGIGLNLAGAAIGYFLLGLTYSLLFTACCATAFLYSYGHLKKRFPLNTLAINAIYGLFPSLAGLWLVGGSVLNPVFISIFIVACFLGAASGNVKDITDIKGDKACGVKNLATMYGVEKTLEICGKLLLSGYALLALFVVTGWLPLKVLLLETLAVLMIILIRTRYLPKKRILRIYALHNIAFLFGFAFLLII